MRFASSELEVRDRELWEGSEESRRRAREETLRGVRLNFARGHKTWVELDSRHIEPAPLRHVMDATTGKLYRPVPLLRVFPNGAPQITNEAAADAYYVIDDAVFFLRSSPLTLAKLEERRKR